MMFKWLTFIFFAMGVLLVSGCADSDEYEEDSPQDNIIEEKEDVKDEQEDVNEEQQDVEEEQQDVQDGE